MIELPTRYEHIALLARGGMGEVHRVYDRHRGLEVALKLLTIPEWLEPEDAVFAFRQEFWALASLSHPGLVEAYDFGYLPDMTPYFTMELVPGYDLVDVMPQSEEQVRTWLPHIVAALGYLHARGYVHCDVSPRNVRCLEAGGAKLMDLGLMVAVGRGGPLGATAPCVAPETIRQAALDGRADLYSLGCVLFYALSGRPPFVAESDDAVFRCHLEEPPPALTALAPEASPDLAAVVERLLAKRPEERVPDAATLAEWLGGEIDAGVRGLLAPPLIGRDGLYCELAGLLEQAGEAAWLCGPEGAGKSRIVAELRGAAQLAGRTTITLRGAGPTAAPYEAIRGWLLALAGWPIGAAGWPPDPARDRLAPYLAGLLPELGVAPAPALSGEMERLRLHDAIATWLEASAPAALWLVDDADRLDPASIELISFLRARGEEAGWSWLFVGDTPIDAVPATSFWLEPLEPHDVLTLAAASLGQDQLPEELAGPIVDLAVGLPAAVTAVLAHWIRTGALKHGGGRWYADPDIPADFPGGLAVAYAGGFRSLDEGARRVGAIAVVLGSGTPLRCLAHVAGMSDEEFFAALAGLERFDVLRRSDLSYDLVRAAAAESEAAAIAPDDLARLHGAAARWYANRLAGQAAPALGDMLSIARHHLQGDDPAAAVPWLERGARQALHLFAADSVEPLIAQALAIPDLPIAQRLGLLTLRGEVLRLRARIDEGLAVLRDEVVPAMRELDDPRLGEVLATVGVLEQLGARYDAARAVLAEALALARARGDTALEVRVASAASRVAFFAGDGQTARELIAEAEQVARATAREGDLGGILAFRGYLIATADPDRLEEGLALVAEAAKLDDALGNPYGLFEALNNRGNLCMAGGRVSEAAEAYEECLTLAGRLSFPLERCFAHLNVATARLEGGDVQLALAHAAEALEWSRAQGRRFPEGYCLALEGLARIYLGELAAGAETLAEGLAVARGIGNKYLELHVLAFAIEAALLTGRAAEACAAIEDARRIAAEIGTAELDRKLALWHVAANVMRDGGGALELAARHLAAVQERGTPADQAYALRRHAEARLLAGDVAGALADIEQAIPLARQAGLGLALAELAWLRGCAEPNAFRAIALLSEARQAAAQAGHEIAAVACLQGLAALGAMADDEARHEVERLVQGLDDVRRTAFLAQGLNRLNAVATTC